jgi:hypothetical protein
MGKLLIFKEFLQFLMVRKRYWLIPIVILMLSIGLLVVFAEASGLAPFIYTLF